MPESSSPASPPASAPAAARLPGRARAFAVTWVAYASYYLGRKGFSVTKARIGRDLGLGEELLASIDTIYLIAYAAGQFGSGALGDRVGARRLVGYGMILSALACALFGAAGGASLLLFAFLVNGVAQSTGWPGTTKAMAAFTTPADRGAVMGIWSTCYQVGGVIATALAARLLARSGWRAAFEVPAIWMALIGVLVLFSLKEKPDAAPAPIDGANATAPPIDAAAEDALRRAAQRQVLRNPAVWCYGASYFCLKLIRYSLLFWLPYYLFKVRGIEEERAGYLSTSFEVGGVAGSLAIGLLSDRLRHLPRSLPAAVSLVGLAAALLLYAVFAPSSVAGNALLLGLIGALLFGPDTLVSGAAAQDAGGPYAAGMAAGVINGIGSVGAILQGVVTLGFSRALGWSGLFYAFVALAFLGFLCLLPTALPRRRARP